MICDISYLAIAETGVITVERTVLVTVITELHANLVLQLCRNARGAFLFEKMHRISNANAYRHENVLHAVDSCRQCVAVSPHSSSNVVGDASCSSDKQRFTFINQ